MKIPTVYNMTRYNTDDLVGLVNKVYMFKRVMGDESEPRMQVIQFREHSRKQEVHFHDGKVNRSVRMTNYVGYSTGFRRHHVKLLQPELLHDSTVEILAKGSQAQLCLPPEGVKMLFCHILSNMEWFSLHGDVASAAYQAASRIPLRYDFGKKPKTPREVIDFERRRTVGEAISDLQSGARDLTYRLGKFQRQIERASRRVTRAKGQFDPATLNRYLTLKGELDQLLISIKEST